MRAIALLALWQLRNSLRAGLTNPRKLVPALFIGAMVMVQLGSLAVVNSTAGNEFSTAFSPNLEEFRDLFRAGVFAFLGMLTLAILESGFGEGFLAFSLADVDYLFTAPVPRRGVLAYRLAGKTAITCAQAGFIYYIAVGRLLQKFHVTAAGFDGQLLGLLAILFCLGGIVNLAFTLKMVLGFGRLATVRRWLIACLVVLLAGLGYVLWQAGMRGLAAAMGGTLPTVVFYPCKVAAAVVVPEPDGSGVGFAMLQLALFYFVTLALLFSRRETFYEASLEGSYRTARFLQAAREQNWAGMFVLKSRARPITRPYTVTPFGRGAMALFWANLAAAAKRPWINGVIPAVLGIAAPLLAVAIDPKWAWAIATGLTCYLLFFMCSLGSNTLRAVVKRLPVVRPLPLLPWQIVLAEAAPSAIIWSLFLVCAGLTLTFSGARYATLVGPLFVVCGPVTTLWLALLDVLAALWYPDAQDKLQRMLGGFVLLTFLGISYSYVAVVLVAPVALGVPGPLAILIYLVPSCAGIAFLTWAVGLVYRRHQPVAQD